MVDRLFSDLRFALRQMSRNPGFTLIAVVTVALGIGANTAIFSVVDALLIRSLPVAEADRLVSPESLPLTLDGFPEGPADAFPFVDELPSFERLAAWSRPAGVNLLFDGEPQRAAVSQVTTGFFETLGVELQLGRPFLDDDDLHVAILSARLWHTRFSGDPDVIGSAITVNGRPVTVIGVTPAGFAVPERAELWLPLNRGRDRLVEGSISMTPVGRLGPDATIEGAQAELRLFAERHLQGSWLQDRVSRAVPLRQVMVGGSRTALLILLGATGVILLIACANLANLFLMRAVVRRHELSVRASLGAGTGRLAGQLTTEALLTSLIGGVLGVLIAFWTLDIVLLAAPPHFPMFADPSIDFRVLGFALVLSLATGLAFGLWPAFRGSRVDLAATLKRSRQGSGASRIRNGPLVVGQVALTLVLLVAGGLLLQSLLRLRSVDPGFEARNAVTASVSLPDAQYPDAAARDAFVNALLTRLEAVPGVEAAGATNHLPLSGALGFAARIEVEGWDGPDQPQDWVGHLAATAGYFDAVGQPIVAGRGFDERDHANAPATVVVSRSLARRYWPDGTPLGERIRFSGNGTWFNVVGVAEDVRTWDLTEAAPLQVYLSANHTAAATNQIVVRGPDPAILARAVRATVRALDPTLPVYGVAHLADVVGDQAAEQRFLAQLLTAFGLLAVILAASGIYGVFAYRVASRRHEIGVRLTFGARTAEITAMVLREAGGLALAGVALGVAGAVASSRLLSGVLFEVEPTNPTTIAAAALVILLVTGAACLGPAGRAARVDPAVVMRED